MLFLLAELIVIPTTNVITSAGRGSNPKVGMVEVVDKYIIHINICGS